MWRIDYYTEPNGREPVAEWLSGLDIKAKEVIMDKVGFLKEHGLALLRTKIMKRIENGDKNFYELRAGNCRIALYHATANDSFILLHGFLKKRQKETREIGVAPSRLREYQMRR